MALSFLGTLSEFQVHLSVFWDQRALCGDIVGVASFENPCILKESQRNVALRSASSSCLPEHSHRLRISSWMAGVLRQWPGPWVNIFKAFEELSFLYTLYGAVRIETGRTSCKNNRWRAKQLSLSRHRYSNCTLYVTLIQPIDSRQECRRDSLKILFTLATRLNEEIENA